MLYFTLMKIRIIISLILASALFPAFYIALSLSNLNANQNLPQLDTGFSRVDGINENLITSIEICPTDTNKIYIGTDKFLYLSEDGGLNWKPIISVKAFINYIHIENNKTYLCTDKGLFQNFNSTKNWTLIFKGRYDSSRSVSSIIVDKERIFIGTNDGLYGSYDGAKQWKKIIAIGSSEITSLLVSPGDDNSIYVATDSGLLKFNVNNETCEKIFFTRKQEVDEIDTPEDIEGKEYEELNESSNTINSIVFNKAKQSIYIATKQGIYSSDLEGKIWVKFPSQGLLTKKINKLKIAFDNSLYAATDRGLFKFDAGNKQWIQIKNGIITAEIEDLAINPSNEDMFVATSHGLFRGKVGNYLAEDKRLSFILNNFSDEPSINQVQSQAIKYAEVNPNKIKSWRRQAAAKALLPKITADVDRNASELVHWDSGQNPDILVKGDDTLEWGVSVSWDLGEFIWNSDQTSIDTRSRLMVQLRQDILDEVNRVYFERRRLQIELLKSPPVDESKIVEKELRIAELTADLDALTGSNFSQTIESRDSQSIE